jgi:hypothetical protein
MKMDVPCGRRLSRLPVLAGLGALALLAGIVPAATAYATQSAPNQAAAAPPPTGSRCDAGLADQLIFPQGTINYYQRVQDTLGAKNTATFARLFIAPGAQHCASAAGPAPANPLQDVVNWVEHRQAPATILATGGVDPSTNEPTQRPLCMYPYLSEVHQYA